MITEKEIRIPSVYWENNACAYSVYQALSPSLKGPGDEANQDQGLISQAQTEHTINQEIFV